MFGIILGSFSQRKNLRLSTHRLDFAIILESFWDDVGIILGSFWDDFGIILGSFWDYFGIILGFGAPLDAK